MFMYLRNFFLRARGSQPSIDHLIFGSLVANDVLSLRNQVQQQTFLI